MATLLAKAYVMQFLLHQMPHCSFDSCLDVHVSNPPQKYPMDQAV